MVKLGDFVSKALRDALPVDRCPTGKVSFRTKAEARRALQSQHGHHTKMKPFRCGFCERYHLGHRRGAIL